MRIGSRAIKRLLLVGAGSALIFTVGGIGSAQADNGVHISTATNVAATNVLIGTNSGAGRCAGCHRAHTAKAEMLLKEAQPALCYTCHGGGAGANTDVQNGTSGVADAPLRGGGFEYALIGSDAGSKDMALPAAGSTRMVTSNQVIPGGASEATTSKHEIDGVTSGTMWGNGAISATINPGKAAVTLECGSCHDPHGNGNYRILRPVPNGAGDLVATVIKAEVTAVAAVAAVLDDPATPLVNEAKPAVAAVAAAPAVMSAGPSGVNIPDAATKTYTTANYWSVVDRTVPAVKGGAAPLATETDGYIGNVGAWCATCHTRYLAQAPAYETNSGDALFTYRHTSNRADKAGVSRPNCIQCHVSHGSNATVSGSSAIVTPGGTVGSTSSRLLRVDQRGTCVMCHNM